MGIILLVLLLLSAWEAADAANPYDYFQFVQQWPAEFCYGSSNCISHLPQYFTVHGLWPTNYSRTSLQDAVCVGTQFNEVEMSAAQNGDLENNLRRAWPQLIAGYGYSDMGFWETEYNKHGTCSEKNLKQTEYFERAYWMWSQYNADRLFRNSRIYRGRYHTRTALENAIWQGTRGWPLLSCWSRKIKVGVKYENVWFLEEVIICFDYLGKNVINCVRRTNCGVKIYYRRY